MRKTVLPLDDIVFTEGYPARAVVKLDSRGLEALGWQAYVIAARE